MSDGSRHNLPKKNQIMKTDSSTIESAPTHETIPSIHEPPPNPSIHQSTNPSIHSGSALLDQLSTLLQRFVILPPHAPETLALWILHTYAFQLRDVSTYIGLESPEKRCGKTTLLSILSKLVNRPVPAANISSPAFFRVIQETQPTLLIDEADTFLQSKDELRGILNAGYTRDTAWVMRVAYQTSPLAHSHSSPGAKPSRFEPTNPEFDDGLAATLPLPKGEGRGEGESDVRHPLPKTFNLQPATFNLTASSLASPAGAQKSSLPSAAFPTPSPTAASSSACNAKPPGNNANASATWTRWPSARSAYASSKKIPN